MAMGMRDWDGGMAPGGTVFMEAAKGGYDRCVRLILPQLTVAGILVIITYML